MFRLWLWFLSFCERLLGQCWRSLGGRCRHGCVSPSQESYQNSSKMGSTWRPEKAAWALWLPIWATFCASLKLTFDCYLRSNGCEMALCRDWRPSQHLSLSSWTLLGVSPEWIRPSEVSPSQVCRTRSSICWSSFFRGSGWLFFATWSSPRWRRRLFWC